MSTLTNRLAMSMPAAGDTNWTNEINGALVTLDHLAAMENVYLVSPQFSAANLGNGSATDRRHFDTIQAALDKINAAGNSWHSKIIVGPGDYEETLDIQNNVEICGVGTSQYHYQPGRVRIRGDGSAAPTVGVTPASGSTIYVRFSNIAFDNSYDTDNASVQDVYLLQADPQVAAPANPTCIDFHACSLRMQTWGPHNKWTYGVRLEGQYKLRLYDTRAGGYNYGGGHSDGYIRCLFGVFGHAATSATAELEFQRSCFHNSTSYISSACIVNYGTGFGGGFDGYWYACASSMTRIDSQEASGATITGIDSDGAAEDYQNSFSAAVVGE